MAINKLNPPVENTLKLFKAYAAPQQNIFTANYVEDCIKHGFCVFDAQDHVIDFIPGYIFDTINDIYGINTYENNQTFHKSLNAVSETDEDTYYAQQILHYFSTYGLKKLGLNPQSYIPIESLNIPDLKYPSKNIVIIRALPQDDIINLINKFAMSVVSPSQYQIHNFTPLIPYITISTDAIASFEFQCIKHINDNTVPRDPTTFLRYLVYRTTGETILIKNSYLCNAIRHAANNENTLACQLLSQYDLTQLATIFFRYKPIFLAFKTHKGCGPIINKIRRLADSYHQPLPLHSAQNFTLLASRRGHLHECEDLILKSSNRNLVKLAYALNNRISHRDSNLTGVFNIRNGKIYVKKDAWTDEDELPIDFIPLMGTIAQTLTRRLRQTISNKIFLIPPYINYTIPFTEKQFIGNIPWGTKLNAKLGANFLVGIHWYNADGEQTDLDLHLNSATAHYGWNGDYATDQDIIYTGDITEAPPPKGAAEAYWIAPKNDDKYILSVCEYAGPPDVEFTLFMTNEKFAEIFNGEYIYNPDNRLFNPIPITLHNQSQTNIGLFTLTDFYFYGGSLSNSRVPRGVYADYIDGIYAKLEAPLFLRDLLESSGATVIDETAPYDNNIIDLSPEHLTSTTLLDIVDGKI